MGWRVIGRHRNQNIDFWRLARKNVGLIGAPKAQKKKVSVTVLVFRQNEVLTVDQKR